jgi:3-phosphoshikimate 1-carboxyvinyltransferase
MAMCLSLAAFNPLASAVTADAAVPVRILEPACVAKTFPDYFEALFSLASAEVAAVPVITVDGPSASGKGTLAGRLADSLGYHLLDSGAIYRAAGVAAQRAGVDLMHGAAVTHLEVGAAGKGLAGLPGAHLILGRLDQIDRMHPGGGGVLAVCLQDRHQSRHFRPCQRIKGVCRRRVGRKGDPAKQARHHGAGPDSGQQSLH